MGCFLGCFGSSENPKRRKHNRYKPIRQHQSTKSQNLEQGDDASLGQSIKDKPCDSLQEIRGKKDEPLSLSKRKKVTFDTNVTTYEHVQVYDYDSTESLLEKNEKGETFPKSSHTHSGVGSYPSNYRYGNCIESDDDVEDSDYEDEDDNSSDHEDEDENNGDDGIICFPESRTESSLSLVLKPIENLTQWKVLKSQKQLNSGSQKENSYLNSIPFPPGNRVQELAVEASLNWLVSSEKNSPSDKRVGCYSPYTEPISSGKSQSQESTITSVNSIEDRPILGALTVDELKQFSGSSCTPRKSPGRSPDDMPIIGSVGSYWSHTSSARSSGSTSLFKGIPNATSKYREDKKVNWENISFETRLERALSSDAAE